MEAFEKFLRVTVKGYLWTRLGCGQGNPSSRLSKPSKNVTGCEP